MNVRLQKETRTLLPVFGATVLAVLAERALLPNGAFEGLAMATLMAGCAFLGASSFGEEFQHRTMPLLLSQPLARGNLWREKMLVLGIALVAVFAVYVLSAGLGGHYETLLLAAVPLVVFCSAPAHVLTAKNTLVGALTIYTWPLFIWFLMLAVYGITSWAMPPAGRVLLEWFERDPYPFVVVPALVYLVYSYRAGHRRFLALEAIDAPSREIGLPARLEALLARPLQGLLPAYSGVYASLLRKELHLQRVSYLIAGLACVAALPEAALHAIHPSDFTMGLLVTNVVVCVFIIPLITAAVAVAEERSLGVLECQLTQPPSALKQWVVKWLVVVGTCVLLEVVLPTMLLMAGHALFDFKGVNFPHGVGLVVVLGYLLLISLGLFASSVSSSTFRALLLGIVLSSGGLSLISLSVLARNPELFGSLFPNLQGLPHDVFLFLWPMVSVVLGGFILVVVNWLAFRNFLHGRPGTRAAWLQSVLIMALVSAPGLIVLLLTVQ